jgi:hypothetical protein
MSTKPRISYTRDQIKEAIRVELTEADHMGKDKSRYYEIVGVIMEGLDKIDKQQSNETVTKGI